MKKVIVYNKDESQVPVIFENVVGDVKVAGDAVSVLHEQIGEGGQPEKLITTIFALSGVDHIEIHGSEIEDDDYDDYDDEPETPRHLD